MTTLRERFEEFFTPANFIRLSQKTKYGPAQEEVIAFFRQELLALAEEINIMPWKPEFADEQKEALAKRSPLYVMGLGEAVTLIRARADELKTNWRTLTNLYEPTLLWEVR